jgi:hypothetical protein
MDRSGKE